MIIKRIATITFKTKFGIAQKYILEIDDKGRTILTSSFVGNWNRYWKIGTVLPTNIQWKQTFSEGKEYWQINAPEELSNKFISSGLPKITNKKL